MKITLNLATRPYTDQGPAIKRLRIGIAVLVAVLGLLVFGLMHLHQKALQMAAEESRVDRAIAGIESEEQGYRAQMQQPANARVLQQAQFLNKLFDEKNFSWTAAMEDLERVLPAGVQVTAIEPQRGKDGRITLHLRISGERERSVAMVRNMEHSRRFVAPRIVGENAENNAQSGVQMAVDTGPGKVSFDLLAEYNPATLEERKVEIAAMKRSRGAAGSAAPAQPAVLAPPRNRPMPNMPPRPGYIPPVMQPNGAQPNGMPGRFRQPMPMQPQNPGVQP